MTFEDYNKIVGKGRTQPLYGVGATGAVAMGQQDPDKIDQAGEFATAVGIIGAKPWLVPKRAAAARRASAPRRDAPRIRPPNPPASQAAVPTSAAPQAQAPKPAPQPRAAAPGTAPTPPAAAGEPASKQQGAAATPKAGTSAQPPQPPKPPTAPTAKGALGKEALKSIRSLEERLAEHRTKLDAFRKNPDAFDNKGFLRAAPSQEVRERIIQGRIKHLEQEIRNFEQQIKQLLGGSNQ